MTFDVRSAAGGRSANSLVSLHERYILVADVECGRARPVSSNVLRFERIFGQPPEMPASILGSFSRSSCVTVKRTSPSPCGSMSKVTRECFDFVVDLGRPRPREHQPARRRGLDDRAGDVDRARVVDALMLPPRTGLPIRHVHVRGSIRGRGSPNTGASRRCRPTACHTFSGVVAM